MRDNLTRTQDVIVLCHLGVPLIERADRLTGRGLVERPRTLRFDDWCVSEDRAGERASMLREPDRAVRAHATR